MSFSKRATIYPGTAPLADILQAEVSGKYNAKMRKGGVDWDAETLVDGGSGSERREATKRRGQIGATGDVDWDTKTLVAGELESGSRETTVKDGKTLVSGNDRMTLVEGDLESGRPNGKTLVTVSGSEEIRDELRILVRNYLDEGLSLLELDYQPSKK